MSLQSQLLLVEKSECYVRMQESTDEHCDVGKILGYLDLRDGHNTALMRRGAQHRCNHLSNS